MHVGIDAYVENFSFTAAAAEAMSCSLQTSSCWKESRSPCCPIQGCVVCAFMCVCVYFMCVCVCVCLCACVLCSRA